MFAKDRTINTYVIVKYIWEKLNSKLPDTFIMLCIPIWRQQRQNPEDKTVDGSHEIVIKFFYKRYL